MKTKTTMGGEDTNHNSSEMKRPASKEKLRCIMEAASALTALGDEESEKGSSCPSSPQTKSSADAKPSTENVNKKESKPSKRFLPDHKKPDAAPTFPEKLMSLMRYADTQGKDFCVEWLPDGKSFVIRNPDEFTRQVVPKFFKATKFSSFTRKLYRWGFRQINRGIGPDDPIIFGNENFDRDNEALISKMRSITAAGTRKQEPEVNPMYGLKRPFDVHYEESNKQRILFDHLLQQKAANMLQQQPLYGGVNGNCTMPLSNAMRQSMMMESQQAQQLLNPFNKFEMLGQQQQMTIAPQQQSPNSLVNHFNMQGQSNMPQQQMPYGNQQSTAEIVNAAIAALRYAN